MAMNWKKEHDSAFLQEIIMKEPFLFKFGSSGRASIWENIADTLNASDAFKKANSKLTKRSVRERFGTLEKKFKKKMREEEKASGISPEMSEDDSLIEEIINKFEEVEQGAAPSNAKQDQDRKKAEEMRKKSMESMGETRKRQEDDEVPGAKKKKSRRSGTDTLEYLRERTELQAEVMREEAKAKKQEQEDLRKYQEASQKQQQQMMLQINQQSQQQWAMMQHQMQQQQQLQQQQQAQQHAQTQLLMRLLERFDKK